MTSANGIFIVINPGFVEEFTIEGDPDIKAKAASAKGAAFTMILNTP